MGKPKCANGLSVLLHVLIADGCYVGWMHCCCGRCYDSFSGVCIEHLPSRCVGACGRPPFPAWPHSWIQDGDYGTPQKGGNSGIADVSPATYTTSLVSMNLRPLIYDEILTTGYRSRGLGLHLPLSEAQETAPPDIECKRISVSSFIASLLINLESILLQ